MFRIFGQKIHYQDLQGVYILWPQDLIMLATRQRIFFSSNVCTLRSVTRILIRLEVEVFSMRVVGQQPYLQQVVLLLELPGLLLLVPVEELYLSRWPSNRFLHLFHSAQDYSLLRKSGEIPDPQWVWLGVVQSS